MESLQSSLRKPSHGPFVWNFLAKPIHIINSAFSYIYSQTKQDGNVCYVQQFWHVYFILRNYTKKKKKVLIKYQL